MRFVDVRCEESCLCCFCQTTEAGVYFGRVRVVESGESRFAQYRLERRLTLEEDSDWRCNEEDSDQRDEDTLSVKVKR